MPAILTWLGRQRPALDLMPADPAREAHVLEWLNWLSSWLHAVCFAQIWRLEWFGADPAAHGGIRAQGRSNVVEAFAAIKRAPTIARLASISPSATALKQHALLYAFVLSERAPNQSISCRFIMIVVRAT